MSFDIRLHYLLLHAFDESGRAMFGSDWTGLEVWAKDYGDADSVREKRKAISDGINALAEREDQLNRVFVDQADPVALREHGDKQRAIYGERERLKRSLHDLPVVTESFICGSAMFKRRCAVESELREAYRSGDLLLLQGCSTVVEWDRWANSTDFQVNYALSMIRAPNDPHVAARRGPGFVRRVQFDGWLQRFGVIPDGSRGLTPEAQARNWLRAEVRRGVKRMKRREYFIEVKKEIPDLSGRAFERIWGSEVPQHWKKSGPLGK